MTIPKFDLFENLENLPDSFRKYLSDHWGIQDDNSKDPYKLLAENDNMKQALSAVKYNIQDWQSSSLTAVNQDQLNTINKLPDPISSIFLRLAYDCSTENVKEDVYSKYIKVNVALPRKSRILDSAYLNEVLGIHCFNITTQAMLKHHLHTMNDLTTLCTLQRWTSKRVEDGTYLKCLLTNLISRSASINTDADLVCVSKIVESLLDSNQMELCVENNKEAVTCMLHLYSKIDSLIDFMAQNNAADTVVFDTDDLTKLCDTHKKFEQYLNDKDAQTLTRYRTLKDLNISREHIITACFQESMDITVEPEINY